MAGARYLLCRPLGGLNDMLCQIERCCLYGERHGRTVIVDSTRHAYFRDVFDHYFRSLQPTLALDAAHFPDPESLAVRPPWLKGRLATYSIGFDRTRQVFIEAERREQITFDFERDHPEPLLVHHAGGGGALSIGALTRMAVRESIVQLVEARARRIGGRYTGVHVRNSDYETIYRDVAMLDCIDPTDPIFVATDDRRVVAYFRDRFGAARAFSFADLPDPAVGPIHRWAAAPDPRAMNRDAIADLLMLACAANLFLFQIQPNVFGTQYSGFSMLAAGLNKDRTLLARLLGRGPAP